MPGVEPKHWKRYDRMERQAVERLDTLETDLPRGVCSVKSCERSHRLYPFVGIGGTFWVCSRHRPLYRKHNEILRRIRAL